MRWSLWFLCVELLLGCAKTITIPKTQQQLAFSSYDVCAQGPFTIRVYTPASKDPQLLRLSFTEEATPAKIFYQVKIPSSKRIIGAGTLEQAIEPRVGGLTPKNQCLGRVMPGLVTGTAGDPSSGSGAGVVVQPGYQAPQPKWVSFAEVPGESPVAEILLKDVAPDTPVEVLFWSEVPYPLDKARIQAELITLSQEKVTAVKRRARAAEIALLRETERFTAAKEKDAYLAALEESDPTQAALYKVQRGKLLKRFSNQWIRSLYEDRYQDAAKELLAKSLAPEVNAFLNARYAQLEAYELWRERRREERKTERRDRQKRAVDRYVKLESWHLTRVSKRDARLEKRELAATETSAKEALQRKRGKKLTNYKRHFKAFNFFTRARTFGNSRPKSFYKLKARAYALFDGRSQLIYKYVDDKLNKKSIKKQARKLSNNKRVLTFQEKKFKQLQSQDKRREAKLKGKPEKQQKKLNVRRGAQVVHFRDGFQRDHSKYYYSKEQALSARWETLAKDVQAFAYARQEQVSAYNASKSNPWTRQDNARKKKYARQEGRGAKKTRREAQHFARLKAKDEALSKQYDAATGDKRDDIAARWGGALSDYRKHFVHVREQICCKANRRSPKDGSLRTLEKEVYALLSLRAEIVRQYGALNKDQHDEAKHGTHRALRRWTRAVKEDKAFAAKLAKTKGAKQEQLAKTRQEKRAKAIAALLSVYDKATPQGRRYLAKAYAEASAMQRSQDVVVESTPPPLPANENQGTKPMDGAVWRPGYWKLVQGAWLWKAGYWELPPGAVPPVRGGQ